MTFPMETRPSSPFPDATHMEDPYPRLARLRAEDPVHFVAPLGMWSGTNAERGDFDAVYACIGLLRNGEAAGLEILELDDLELACARFAELSAGRKL